MAGKDKQQGGGENFADNPDKASEAGRKGGQEQQKGSGGGSRQSQQDNDSEAGGQQRGGSGNFANDPERARQAERAASIRTTASRQVWCKAMEDMEVLRLPKD